MPYLFSETKCQLRYDTLLLYDAPVYSPSLNAHYKAGKQTNFKSAKTYSGKITVHTKKRISKAINIMLQSVPKQTVINPITRKKEIFKLNFITLTISDEEKLLTPKEAYKLLLKPFLKWLTKTKKVSTYIWKAELQRNGQIHYHITTNKWLYWQEIRNKWNYISAKAGMLDNYIKVHKHTNANSTDVHKVYKIRNMCAYLHKELCKNIQSIENRVMRQLDFIMCECNYELDQESIQLTYKYLSSIQGFGKLWDCSTNLKGQPYYTVYFDEIHERLLAKAMKTQKLTEVIGDQFTVIKGNKHLSKMLLTPQERDAYAQWILSIRNQNILALT